MIFFRKIFHPADDILNEYGEFLTWQVEVRSLVLKRWQPNEADEKFIRTHLLHWDCEAFVENIVTYFSRKFRSVVSTLNSLIIVGFLNQNI